MQECKNIPDTDTILRHFSAVPMGAGFILLPRPFPALKRGLGTRIVLTCFDKQDKSPRVPGYSMRNLAKKMPIPDVCLCTILTAFMLTTIIAAFLGLYYY